MSNLTNPPGGGDLPDRFRNVGEQIQSFFDFAENNPDRAVPFFVNIWETQASLTTRALALQGLGVAAKHYHVKEALADWDVLRDIAKEVKGKGEVSNDLTRWAAASALDAIGYSQQSLQHLEGGGFTEPLDRIRREIRDRKLAEINRIQRLNSRGEITVEYERHLEFWLYGPVDELLNGNESSMNYHYLVSDVIDQLHGRGVYLGLSSRNNIVQQEALRQARLIFRESAAIEEYLYGLLEVFLSDSSHAVSLRINAAEIIGTASGLKKLTILSKLLLEDRELRNAAVRLLTPYKQELARVDPDPYTVLVACEYWLDQPDTTKLTIPQIETHISLFETAIESAKNLESRYKISKLLVKFRESQQESHLSDIRSWIQKLTNQKSDILLQQNIIKSYQSFLHEAIDAINNLHFLLGNEKIKTLPNQQAMYSTDYYTYNQCIKLKNEFWQIKEYLTPILKQKQYELESSIKKINSISEKICTWGIGAIMFSFLMSSYGRDSLYLGLVLISVAIIVHLYSYILKQRTKTITMILDNLKKI